MSSSKEKGFFKINKQYIESLEDLIALKEKTVQTQEETIAFQREKIAMQKEHIKLLEQLNENLTKICEAEGLI